MKTIKRLYRSVRSKVFGGVAGGIAEYFDIDPIIIRLLFVIIAFAGGGGVIVYLILWIALPIEPIVPFTMNMDAGVPDPQASATYNPDPSAPFIMPEKAKNNGGLIGGVLLISLGLIFLANRFIPYVNFHHLWPLILVVFGGVLIATSIADRKEKDNNNL